jgi:multicomponent Na+:H+ antiporter subunit E
MILYNLKKIYRSIEFLLFYLGTLVKSNFHLAYYILHPKIDLRPAIIKVPVNLQKSHAILLLANLISMTPGTFTMDLTEDNKFMYVHILNFSGRRKQVKEIGKLEKRVSNLFN